MLKSFINIGQLSEEKLIMGEKWDERKEMKKRWGEKTAGIEIDGGGGEQKNQRK